MADHCQMSNIKCTLVGNKIFDHSYRRCSNYIFILDLAPGFNGLGKSNSNTRRETFKYWDLVHLILEILWYVNVLSTELLVPSVSASSN